MHSAYLRVPFISTCLMSFVADSVTSLKGKSLSMEIWPFNFLGMKKGNPFFLLKLGSIQTGMDRRNYKDQSQFRVDVPSILQKIILSRAVHIDVFIVFCGGRTNVSIFRHFAFVEIRK